MDTRIDVFVALGLRIGDAVVIRNAGGRVTSDAIRSLVLAATTLGVDAVVVMHHTRCALEGVTNTELRAITGADFDFLPIPDHELTLRSDIDTIATQPYLQAVTAVAGFVFDVEDGHVADIVRWERPAT
jgi:carbonic anhydrase